MKFNEENETKVTELLGIINSWCCSSCRAKVPWCRISVDGETSKKAKPLKPLTNIQDESCSKDNDSLTLMSYPGLSPLVSQTKCGLSEPKASNEIRLEVPVSKLQCKKRDSTEIWRPSGRRKSNWDIFFELKSTPMELNPSESSTFSDNDELLFPSLVELGSWKSGDEADRQQCKPTLLGHEAGRINTEIIYQTGQNPMLPECLRRKGEIFLMYKSKAGMRYTSAPWDWRIEEVAAWLNRGSSKTIPISRQIHPTALMAENVGNFRKQTFLEVFGDRLDPEKVGIIFFIGPVEGKISFKMTVCDLPLLEMATRNSSLPNIGECEMIKYVS